MRQLQFQAVLCFASYPLLPFWCYAYINTFHPSVCWVDFVDKCSRGENFLICVYVVLWGILKLDLWNTYRVYVDRYVHDGGRVNLSSYLSRTELICHAWVNTTFLQNTGVKWHIVLKAMPCFPNESRFRRPIFIFLFPFLLYSSFIILNELSYMITKNLFQKNE